MFLFAAALALQSPTYRTLSSESSKDPAAASRVEKASADAGQAYNGDSPIPFHVEVLSPVELIDPASGRRAPAAAAPVPAPVAASPAPAGDERPAYHFEGKRPMGGLTIYTPVRDQAGRDNTTRASGGNGGLLGLLKKAVLALLVVAAIVALALLL